MHSTDYAVARCLSVHPSVCLSHAGILSLCLNVSSNLFHHWFLHTKRYGNIPMGTSPNGSVKCREYEKIVTFYQYIAFFLGNNTR